MQELDTAVATPGEMLRFYGTLLAMALDPVHGGIETYWDATNPTSTCVLECEHPESRFRVFALQEAWASTGADFKTPAL